MYKSIFKVLNREKRFSESFDSKKDDRPSKSRSKDAEITDISVIDYEIDENIAMDFW